MPNGKFLRLRRTAAELRSNSSGNAALMMALAMPVLIGSTGIAVDVAQWYMWKRELQFAVDQAALAAAWARTDDATKDNYTTRADQEYAVNLQSTKAFAVATPTVALANYDKGTDNSVKVSATASHALPFTSILTGNAVTVYASAQASFAAGASFQACLLAVDENEDASTVKIDGNAKLKAGCGIAALSSDSISITGNGLDPNNLDPGVLMSRGGIDPWFAENGYEVVENLTTLVDPYADLSPPSTAASQVARTYTCNKGATSTTATATTYQYVKHITYSGNKNQQNTVYSTTTDATTQVGNPQDLQVVANGTVENQQTTATVVSTVTGLVSNKAGTYYRTDDVTYQYKKYTNVVVTTTPEQANVISGTYTDLDIHCQTVFTGGIYVIDGSNGGRLKITGQYPVTGAGVMFILTNGAYIDIAGGSQNVNLTAMTVPQMEAIGIPSDQAVALDGMLVFEDRNSPGAGMKPSITGNALTTLNGTIYLPKSQISIGGTATVTSRCLMIAAYQINIGGTADFSTFCPPCPDGEVCDPATSGTTVATSDGKVRLVA